MAAPEGIKWGSVAGGYGRIGIYIKLTNTATQTTRHTEIWFWSKYSVSDYNNNFYYNDNATSATTNKGSISIKTTVNSGVGWSTSNQIKLKEYNYTFNKKTNSSKRYVAAKLTDVDRVGGTMTVSTSYTIPALATYTVKYNANGGLGAPSTQIKTYGKTLALSNKVPTRTGYTFKGWATSSSGTVTYKAGDNYTTNASVVLYAVWQINTYTVKYNANGGSGAPSSQTKTYGKALTLSSKVPTRKSVTVDDGEATISYTFKGWSKSFTATTVTYKAGASYTANASITLYAVWSTKTTINTYDILYETGDGTEVDSQTKIKGTAITLSNVIPKRNGFNFVNWNTVIDGSGISYNSGDLYNIDSDLTLYAIWTPWTHTVKFNINGGVGNIPSEFIKTGGVDQIISEITPIKNKCVFSSWNTKPDGSGLDYYSNEVYDNEQDGGIVTLYATWNLTDIYMYKNGEYQAIEFEESDDYLSLDFINNGTIHYNEFIEGDISGLDLNGFYATELTERTIPYLTNE